MEYDDFIQTINGNYDSDIINDNVDIILEVIIHKGNLTIK